MLYPCSFGKALACPGGVTNSSHSPSCGDGYTGVLCAVCDQGFMARFGSCKKCSVTQTAISITITVACILLGLTAIFVVERFGALSETISAGVVCRILWATMQIMGAYSLLLSDIMMPPLDAFLDNFRYMTDMSDVLLGIGFGCWFRPARTFRFRLLVSTVLPALVTFCIGCSYLFHTRLLKHGREGAFASHIWYALLTAYLVLPSTTSTIFRAFLCNENRLGPNGERYMIDDYDGELLVI